MNNQGKHQLTFFSYLFLWFGAAISIAEIMTGGLLSPLGFKNGLLVIFVGHLIGTTILVLGGVIGYNEKLPAIQSTQISFGMYGTYLFTILNVLQLIGWTAVMIISGARSINIISKVLWSFDAIHFWSILIGLLICFWIYLGMTGFKKINIVAVSLLFLLTIVLSTVIFKEKALFTKESVGTMAFGLGIELNVIMPLSWLPLIADYTRFSRSKKDCLWGSWLGYFIGSSWMYFIGLGAGILSNNPDPTAMMLAANLGLSALAIVLLSTVTTTFLDAYSAGVSFLNIAPKLKEKLIAIIMTLLGAGIAILVPIEKYESFLYAIGSVFAPLFAIVLVDYFLLKNKKIQDGLLINWGAVFSWLIGIVMYYSFIKTNFFLGATIPVMILTGVIYAFTWRWTNKWKLTKKSENYCQL